MTVSETSPSDRTYVLGHDPEEIERLVSKQYGGPGGQDTRTGKNKSY
jgi:hypothetical protein